MNHYRFPLIQNISQVLPLIKDRKEFGVYEKDGGYTVINYNVAFEDTFPPVETDNDAILRELRGMIFRTSDGSVMSRRYHKFFNVGEREETSPQFVDLSLPHVILEKLDGSMITPLVADGKIRWGTKAGLTDVALPVEEFVKHHPQYEEFAEYCLSMCITPIFEWCSRKQKIVLDYAEDQLILTAIRLNNRGNYLPYNYMSELAFTNSIPVVKALYVHDDKHDIHDIRSLVEVVSKMENTEGYVVRFDDGHMVKVKCEWYLQLHHAKDVVRFEKNVLQIILEDKLDDLIPLLQPDEVQMVREYQKNVWNGIDGNVLMLQETFADLMSQMKSKEKREFAVHHVKKLEKVLHPFMFAMWDGKDPKKLLVQELLKSCSNQNRLDNNRWLMLNAKFNEVKGNDE